MSGWRGFCFTVLRVEGFVVRLRWLLFRTNTSVWQMVEVSGSCWRLPCLLYLLGAEQLICSCWHCSLRDLMPVRMFKTMSCPCSCLALHTCVFVRLGFGIHKGMCWTNIAWAEIIPKENKNGKSEHCWETLSSSATAFVIGYRAGNLWSLLQVLSVDKISERAGLHRSCASAV